MTTCSACGDGGQPEGAKFCSECGTALTSTGCADCGATLLPSAKFCSECGTPHGSAVPRAVASRRVTSVLFGDLVGFTTLSEARDQEDVRELLSRYFEECRQVIARYGGTVEKFIGDAVMAVWGVPTAHEDDAERAVRAGLELVNAVAALGSDVGVPQLAMRVGIVTGEVAVTVGATHEGMVAGDAVNTAARVQTAAAPGQVWVDETTRLLTSSAISYLDVGSHPLKGKLEPVPLWAVRAVVAAVGGAQRADGLEAPHVGRDRELRLVKELFHAAEESGRPALLVVDGEPGVGKTRLAWEFEKYADGLSTGIRWHSGRCLAYGEGVAFFALADAIRNRLQRLVDDSGEGEDGGDQRMLLTAGLDRYVPDPEERAWLGPRLGALLGISTVGTFPREDLFGAWATFLHRISEDEHCVTLIIDDAQHADDGLLAFLEFLLSVGTFPCLVMLLTRPGLLEATPSLAANRRATVLHLDALTERDMGALLDGLVVGLPVGVRDTLVERSEGVPLFAVETVRSLIDRDLVVPRGGQYVLADPGALDLGSVGAPASLQALIAARLDTLTPVQRQVVELGSVLGTSFSTEQITALTSDVPDLDEVLRTLVALQVLRQAANRFSNDFGHYQFVQSVVRQVAYGRLSRHDRKASHLAVVRLFEAAEDGSADLAPIVAQHYVEAIDAVPDAQDVPELAERAVTHLLAAAERAAALGSPKEAAGHLEVAFARCVDPVRAAHIESDLALQLEHSGDHRAAVEHATRARDALDAMGDPVAGGNAVATLAVALSRASGDYEEAYRLADERFGMLRQQPDAGLVLLRLTKARVVALLRTGADLRDAVEEHARYADRVGDESEIADSHISLALHYMVRGPHRLGRVLLESAARIAEGAHDSRTLARALTNLNADWTQDDCRKGAEYGARATAASREVGDPSQMSNTVVNLLLAQLLSGEWEDALSLAADHEFSDGDRPYSDLVHGVIAVARKQPWSVEQRLDDPRLQEDFMAMSCLKIVHALAGLESGRSGVGALALSGLHQVRELSGLFDDFTSLFRVATDVAWESGDYHSLGEMLAIAANDRENRHPVGLRCQEARMRGLLSMQEGGDPAEVEGLLRAAAADARLWQSPVQLSRVLADLGVFLTRQGRAEEAAEPLGEARATFLELGAVRWSHDLDAALAGVDA